MPTANTLIRLLGVFAWCTGPFGDFVIWPEEEIGWVFDI